MKTIALVLTSLSTLISTSAVAQASSTGQQCLEVAKAAICYVEPASNPMETYERPCLETPKTYEERIINILQKLPEKILPMFCHMKRIYIEKDFLATGYASPFYERVPGQDKDNLLAYRYAGWVIGLSEQKIFQNGWTLDSFLAHKDQTLFGRNLMDPLPAELPRMEFSSPRFTGEELFLYGVLIHEVGHLIDFANKVNRYHWQDCVDENNKMIEDCLPTVSGTFALFSWSPKMKHRPDSKFFDRPLCFYSECDHTPEWSPIPLSRADEFFTELSTHPYFMTSYAPVSPAEDFAETFTQFFMLEDDTLEAEMYFPSSGLRHPIFKELRDGKSRYPLHGKYEYVALLIDSGLRFKPPHDQVFWRPKNLNPKIFNQTIPHCRYAH